MSLLMAEPIDRPPTLFGEPAGAEAGRSAGPTLDAAIVRAWEGLTAHAAAATCPVCGGTLHRRAAGGGRCDRCASTLS